MQRRTTALAAAVSLLPLGQPFLLGTLGITTATTAVVLQDSAAVAQDASAVARIAKAITVRIEGATQGSGVIVKKDGNSYTVLTAWHVVRSSRPGEEIGIYTSDGQQQRLDQGSIERLGQVDMAVLTFSNPGTYQVASVGDIKSVSSGNPIFVSGFPLPTSSVPTSIWRFLDGKVIANATVAIPDGYQLLYSNPTLPGMSGGSVLNARGQLVGIHGRSERDDLVSMRTGKAVSTGTNQAVPISYYREISNERIVIVPKTKASSADDYLALAHSIHDVKGREKEIIGLMNKSLSIKPSEQGYLYRGYAKGDLKDYQGEINDYDKGLEINPNNPLAYNNRGIAKEKLGDSQGAITDYDKAISINPQYDAPYVNRGVSKRKSGDLQGAIADYNKAIEINPQDDYTYSVRGNIKYDLQDYQGAISDYTIAIKLNPNEEYTYFNRGLAKARLGDHDGSIQDFSKSISINPHNADAYNNRARSRQELGDEQGACMEYKKALSFGSQESAQFLNSERGSWCRNMR